MRHIKLFESYDKGYEEISETEYFNLFQSQYNVINDFNQSEIKNIKSVFDPVETNFYHQNTEISIIKSNINTSSYNFIDRIEIYKLPDEWYILKRDGSKEVSGYLTIIFKYYKCDQMDGLLNCIKDNMWL